jgi:hypothetical protein
MIEPEILRQIIQFIERKPVIFGGLFVIIGSLITLATKSIYFKAIKKSTLKQSAAINKSEFVSQENFGGGKIEIHNHYNSGVEVGTPDDIFNKPGVASSQVSDILESGYSLIDISKEDLDWIGEIFNQIFEKHKSPRNGLTMLKGAVFALGSKKYNNKEWREHCALSLRELLHDWKEWPRIAAAFKKINNEKINFPDAKGPDLVIYQKMQYYYDYFSSTCHHYNTFATFSLRLILDDKNLKDSDNNDEMYLKIVNSFINMTLSLMNNCINK